MNLILGAFIASVEDAEKSGMSLRWTREKKFTSALGVKRGPRKSGADGKEGRNGGNSSRFEVLHEAVSLSVLFWRFM